MRRYETIYILRPSQGEEEINATVENTTKIITDDGGTLIELDKWGMRKLGYPIDKEIQGYYVYCDYAGTPAGVAEVERKFRIDDTVLRYMTIKTAESISDDEIAGATGEVAARLAAVEETSEVNVDAKDGETAKAETEKAAPAEAPAKPAE